MIVADTNVVSYMYFDHPEYTPVVKKLLQSDKDWAAPLLWRSEFCHVIHKQVRANHVHEDEMCELLNYVTRDISIQDVKPDYHEALTLAYHTGCTSYDCEYISVANILDIPLITFDKKLLRTFPNIAMQPADYLNCFAL